MGKQKRMLIFSKIHYGNCFISLRQQRAGPLLQKLYQPIQQSPLFTTSTQFLIEILHSKEINNDEKTIS